MQVYYKGGRTKALTFSYDDGQAYDRRLVEIFNRYQVKATFHLNSGNLGRERYVTKEEAAALYRGHEIACHGAAHAYFTHLSQEELVREVWEDRRALESIAECPVVGMSYPFGEVSGTVARTLKDLGFEYSRTVQSHGYFRLPCDFLRWDPTCHHSDMLRKADAFLNPPEYERLPLFYVWGHSFEFGRAGSWELMEQFCAKVSQKDDVWYATNLEIERYLRAVRGLVTTADGTVVCNPSGVSVWVETCGRPEELHPGETLALH